MSTEEVSEADPEPDPAPEASPEEPTTPEVALVDLLQLGRHHITASSVYRDDPTQLGRLRDGDFETAWNSQTMAPDASDPVTITVVVPEDAEMRSIMMTVGYTKLNRGRDLFLQNLRIRHVRITPGADTFEADLDVDERGLQTIPVNGGGGEWLIEFTSWEAGEREDYRELCVSELRVMGVPGTGVLPDANSAQTDAEIDAEDAEFEANLAALDAEIAQMDPADILAEAEGALLRVELSQRPDLHLTVMVLAPEIDGRTPVGARSTYSKADADRVNCFFRLQNPGREQTEVFTCVIRNAAEEELGRAPFMLTE